jgi:hypothetical protein
MEKNVLALRNRGKLEKLPRQPFSELSSESRNFECDTEVQTHETGISSSEEFYLIHLGQDVFTCWEMNFGFP